MVDIIIGVLFIVLMVIVVVVGFSFGRRLWHFLGRNENNSKKED